MIKTGILIKKIIKPAQSELSDALGHGRQQHAFVSRPSTKSATSCGRIVPSQKPLLCILYSVLVSSRPLTSYNAAPLCDSQLTCRLLQCCSLGRVQLRQAEARRADCHLGLASLPTLSPWSCLRKLAQAEFLHRCARCEFRGPGLEAARLPAAATRLNRKI